MELPLEEADDVEEDDAEEPLLEDPLLQDEVLLAALLLASTPSDPVPMVEMVIASPSSPQAALRPHQQRVSAQSVQLFASVLEGLHR